jgi:hypothetical protein
MNSHITACADPREVFLARAAARDRLFLSGDIDIDTAIDGLVDAFYRLRPCTCMQESYRTMMKPLRSRRRSS